MVDWRDRKLFKKPKWLKPELEMPWYYVHVIILVIVILFIVKQFFNHDMLTVAWVLKFSVAAIIGDTVAHTIMGRD